jgi:hypothetical protein
VPLPAACPVDTAAGLKEWMFAGTWLRNCTTNQNCSSNCDLMLGLMCLFLCPLPPWCGAHAKALTSEPLCLPSSLTALRPLCSATLHMPLAPHSNHAGALFKALYKWFEESGPVYLLPTGPVSSFLVISDPAAAKHVLRSTDNSNRNIYDKGLVAEVRKTAAAAAAAAPVVCGFGDTDGVVLAVHVPHRRARTSSTHFGPRRTNTQ